MKRHAWILLLFVVGLQQNQRATAQGTTSLSSAPGAESMAPIKLGEEATRQEALVEKERAAADQATQQLLLYQGVIQTSVVTISKLDEQIERRRSELSSDTTRKAEVQRELADLEKNRASAQGELSAAKEEQETLQRKIDAQRKSFVENAKKLDAIRQELERLASQGVGQLLQIIKVTVGTQKTEVRPNGLNRIVPRLKDSEEGCRIQVDLQPALQQHGIQTMVDAGIQRFELLDTTGAPLPVGYPLVEPNSPSFSAIRQNLCERIRGRLSNEDHLVLRVHFAGAKDPQLKADYHLVYEKPTLQFTAGVGLFVGAGDLTQVKQKTQFTAFPALRIGGRWNRPLGDDNRDFYLGGNLLVGGGFVLTSDSNRDKDEPNPQGSFSALLGASISVGKFLEVGIVRDVVNKTWMVAFAPSTLTSSFVGS